MWILPALAACALPVSAGTLRYSIEIPSGGPVRYELSLEVRHPGELAVEADWSGGRVLSFRLEGPGTTVPVLRRSGPAPQRLSASVGATDAGNWNLTISGITGRSGGHGTLSIVLPSAPRPAVEKPPAAPKPVEPRVEPEPQLPPGLPASWVEFASGVSRFRARLRQQSVPDSCRWQADLAGFLADQRDALVRRAEPPDDLTRYALHSLAEAIAGVEALRTSKDPIVAGPPPDNDSLRPAWIRARRERFQSIETRLDDALLLFQRGHAPDLEDQTWPVRLISCVTACERHFEERGRLGEERASHRQLVADQWSRMLEAAELLETLGDLGD